MALRLPSWLEWFLDGLNRSLYIPPWDVDVGFFKIADKGEWISWHLNIGDWIKVSLNSVLGVIDAAIDAVIGLIPDVSDIWWSIVDLWEAAQAIPDWVEEFVKGLLDDLRDGLIGTIFDLYDFAVSEIAGALETAKDYADDIYYASIGKVAEMIDDAVGNLMSEIRDTLNLVEEFREEMVDLFFDPLDWLYRKFTAMIEHFW